MAVALTGAAKLKRINVVGSACSGKTTVSRIVSERLGLPHVELDVLYRGQHIEPVPAPAFMKRVESTVQTEAWVVDGDRAPARQLILDRAQGVVWLDYRLGIVLTRYFRRTLSRRKMSQAFWPETGANEGWRRMLRRGSLFRLILTTHGRRRRELQGEIEARENLTVFRFRSPRRLRRWLGTL